MMIRPTIYQALRAKLGREPTRQELCDDVKRILSEVTVDLAGKGAAWPSVTERERQ